MSPRRARADESPIEPAPAGLVRHAVASSAAMSASARYSFPRLDTVVFAITADWTGQQVRTTCPILERLAEPVVLLRTASPVTLDARTPAW